MQSSNSILFFIVVHDIKIIKAFEDSNKYSCLPAYKYLLVGDHHDDYTSDKIIQCNKLINNIEDKKNYLAYTAWFAAANNDIIPLEFKYVFFLEYDTVFIDSSQISLVIENIFKEGKNVYGTNPFCTTSCFLDDSIFNSLLVSFLIKKNITDLPAKNKQWMATNNMAFDVSFLREFFADNLTKDFLFFLNNHKMAGHNLERFLSVYCFLRYKPFGFITPLCIKHEALDSHNTQGRHADYEKFKITNKISH